MLNIRLIDSRYRYIHYIDTDIEKHISQRHGYVHTEFKNHEFNTYIT